MLFSSYLDGEGCTWVASYDFNTGEIDRNNIWQGQSDLHSANPLMIRPDGRIQVNRRIFAWYPQICQKTG